MKKAYRHYLRFGLVGLLLFTLLLTFSVHAVAKG